MNLAGYHPDEQLQGGKPITGLPGYQPPNHPKLIGGDFADPKPDMPDHGGPYRLNRGYNFSASIGHPLEDGATMMQLPEDFVNQSDIRPPLLFEKSAVVPIPDEEVMETNTQINTRLYSIYPDGVLKTEPISGKEDKAKFEKDKLENMRLQLKEELRLIEFARKAGAEVDERQIEGIKENILAIDQRIDPTRALLEKLDSVVDAIKAQRPALPAIPEEKEEEVSEEVAELKDELEEEVSDLFSPESGVTPQQLRDIVREEKAEDERMIQRMMEMGSPAYQPNSPAFIAAELRKQQEKEKKTDAWFVKKAKERMENVAALTQGVKVSALISDIEQKAIEEELTPINTAIAISATMGEMINTLEGLLPIRVPEKKREQIVKETTEDALLLQEAVVAGDIPAQGVGEVLGDLMNERVLKGAKKEVKKKKLRPAATEPVEMKMERVAEASLQDVLARVTVDNSVDFLRKTSDEAKQLTDKVASDRQAGKTDEQVKSKLQTAIKKNTAKLLGKSKNTISKKEINKLGNFRKKNRSLSELETNELIELLARISSYRHLK